MTHKPASGSPYDQLMAMVCEASLLRSTAALLDWDQQTMMPPGGLAHRARQMAQLARLTHAMSTEPRRGELLGECEAEHELVSDALSESAVNLREIRRDYDRATKLPPELVEELAGTRTVAQAEWAEARKAGDFERFRPWFEKTLLLLRRKAECLGWAADGEPWDALADGHEPGCTAGQVKTIFAPLRRRLVALIAELADGGSGPGEAMRRLVLPLDQLKVFVRSVAERIGFDFARGRLDESTHPFCGGTHCHDVRMTTRYSEPNPIDPLFSTIHEAGHGMYEQGLPDEHIGTPMGRTVSLGIHESQSRLWENLVGRSRSFWAWCLPRMRKCFGTAVDGLSLDDVYSGANVVRPDFIRVEADEATYNLHIMVRFEIERALMKGDLGASDVPGVWNEKYRQYLGIDVPDDRHGCLQDIHWSMGSIGYFPTYTLGNLYAAQFFEKALSDIPDLYEQFEAGEFATLRNWLKQHIHAHGMRYRAPDLCERITGKPVSHEPLLRHLEGKLT